MESAFARHFDALAHWRSGVDEQAAEFGRFLAQAGLLPEAAAESLASLRERLASDRLVLAFVAEFSRGKSELINAIFFADTGRRLLPAAPGRTTMCTVELGFDSAQPPLLSLLPIETRHGSATLPELRGHAKSWARQRLDLSSPDQMAGAFGQITRTKAIAAAAAHALGFWNEATAADALPDAAAGPVDVPVWRHAVINYPHPLLRRGLVVLDTPGLNAIGTEPELTLNLLPAAHAVVFVLGADTGVTQSDLAIWRDRLGGMTGKRYVVLNKVDTLADPLLSAAAVQAQILGQRERCAAALGVPLDEVFALSARQALAAQLRGDAQALDASGLPALATAFHAELVTHRRELLAAAVLEVSRALERQARHQLREHRRQAAEQLLELRGLRGKNGIKVQAMRERVEADTADFECCGVRLAALRMTHARLLQDALRPLAVERLRGEVVRMRRETGGTLFNLGARRSFAALCARLLALLSDAQTALEDTREVLITSCRQLNNEFGFALAVPAVPELGRAVGELASIQRSYGQHLGLSNTLRLADAKYFEQFVRMLHSKLHLVFETTRGDIDRWSRAASAQIEAQLRNRRKAFMRRRETLARVQLAAGELELRIDELEQQERHWQHLLARLEVLGGLLRGVAQQLPRGDAAPPAPEREPAAERKLARSASSA